MNYNRLSTPFNKKGGNSSMNSNEDLTDNMILKNLEQDDYDIEPYD